METFTEYREFEINEQYDLDRRNTILTLDSGSIDAPIADIVSGFAELPHCFPLQSCAGHFICDPGQDIHTLDSVPAAFSGRVRYRIAYIALCLENSRRGRLLRESMAGIPTVDPGTIQFGSADWFWDRFPNSYVLQVEPERHKHKDEAILHADEARHVQTIRDLFFEEMRKRLLKDRRL